MAKEICISSTPHETRLAILEDDQLAEIYYERENEYTLAGSIYNGRVTRVLPGMQSAFVDIGLERDAFLYVTDFIELDDQEETDELEKAAATPQAPREVHHARPAAAAPEERAPRSAQRTEPRPETFIIEETLEETVSAPEKPAAAEADEDAQEPSEAGTRRWRGRRRRRGGRSQSAQAEAPQQQEAGAAAEPAKVIVEPAASARVAQAPEEPAAEPHTRERRAPKPFVLPGESLSKYGGTSAPEAAQAESSAPARPASTFKPSSLIETPIAWDGSGLLPGESLARHRRSSGPAEAEPESAPSEEEETSGEESGQEEASAEEIEFVEDSLAVASDEDEALSEEDSEDELENDAEFEEEEIASPDASSAEDERKNASASYRVDPTAPSGFRLFGFGKKKKEEIAPATSVSSYKPGKGLVEEEVIEGEEIESAPRHRRHKPEAHDLDDFEEQTLPSHLRINFDDRTGEDEVEAAEEESAATAAPRTPGRERRERGGRGQRGRGGREGREGRRGQSRRSAQTSDLPIISELLKPGQEILVQIAKEPIAKKGARITSHIALPGRFLVFMPTVSHVGVSRKIESEEERHRLKRILLHERGESTGGFIVRTAAEGTSEEELRADLRFLINLWNDIKQRSESSKSPSLIYHDLSLVERILRDQVSDNFSNIWVDSEADYERIVRFLNRFSPTLVRRVKLYTKETPLFEHFGIQDEISKALRSKVWLKSGGSIVINQTEALVAIDINTGKYVGKSARLEDTIVKTNLDAVPEIVRQIRLRDLGGIIVIDFIDMDERKNRYKVLAALEEALKADRAPTKVLQFNDFGLVAITRKRVKQSLERTLSIPCPTCQATGMVKSPVTVCNEIYTELRKMRKHFEGSDVTLRVHPETVKVLKANSARWLSEFEELTGRNLLLKSDPTLHPEQFDIQG
jgi:Rne/Rng family ribonuclease